MPEEKKNSIDELIKQADEQLVEYLKSGKYKDFLKNMSNLHSYSIHNQMLILAQRENATKVKGMSSWNYLGRSVLPGEKGIKIIAPIIKTFEKESEKENKKTEQVRKVIGFKAGYVFDYSQTQGKELEFFNFDSGMINEHYEIILKALESTVPNYRVQFVPNISGGADGMCAYKVKMISVKDNMPKEKTLTTLVHEIAHALTESIDRSKFKGLTKQEVTQIKEVEAESIAFVISNRLGLRTEEFNMGYIANWSNNNIEMFRDNLEVIKKISNQILSTIEPQIQIDIKDLNKKKEQEKQMENKIKVLVKEPYKKAEIKEVENALKTWQELVGGTIQVVSMPKTKEIDIICNDEGKIQALDGNFFLPEYEDCIVGSAVLVGFNEEGEFTSLTEDQIKKANNYVEQYELKQGESLYENFDELYSKAINKMKEKEM